MKTRFIILKDKFRTRCERLREELDFFLSIWWKQSVLNQFTVHEYGLAEDASLELESLEANNNILKQFKAERMKETVRGITMSSQEDLWAAPLENVQKALLLNMK